MGGKNGYDRSFLEEARALLDAERLDALLVTDLLNVRRLCGFTGTNGVLALFKDDAVFFTDSRYTLQARQETRDVIVRESADPDGAAVELLKEKGVGYTGFEAEGVSHRRWLNVSEALTGADLVDVKGAITRLRARKSSEEIGRLAEASRLAEEAVAAVLPYFKAGSTEEDIARRFHETVLGLGGEGLSFETIVAAGPRGALPHAKPGKRVLADGDLVVFDFGVKLDGYCSDQTLTLPIGRVGGEAEKVYGVVLAAQKAAIAAVKPGIELKDVDRAARQVIEEAGYGPYFGHGTGHGVGLAVHETPTVGPKSSATAEVGMVFTVEPGVYLAERFGVRIEDMVIVTPEGGETLTRLPKDWGALPAG